MNKEKQDLIDDLARKMAVNDLMYDYRIRAITEFAKKLENLFAIPDVRLSLLSEEDIREPIQSALYATRHFLTDECTELADGILTYLNDYGFKVVRQ